MDEQEQYEEVNRQLHILILHLRNHEREALMMRNQINRLMIEKARLERVKDRHLN